MTSPALRALAAPGFAWLLASVVASCVVIPYRPDAETQHDRAAIAAPERLRVSVGPRNFLDEMAKAVSKADSRVQPVDGQTFIDTASPARDLTLARLQDPATLELIKPLQLDYVVLLAEPADKVIDASGDMLFILGFFGLGKVQGSTTYWATVLDARTLTLVDQLTSRSVGTDAGIGLVYGLFVLSDTSGSARKDLVSHLVETMATARPSGPLRVAFLAVEPIPTAEQIEAEAEKRDLATPQWAPDRYPKYVAAPRPAEGYGLVYLYWPDSVGLDFMTMDLHTGAVDPGTVITRLYGGGYYPFQAPAGELTVRVQPWFSDRQPAPVTVQVEPGVTYYLQGATNHSFWRGLEPTLRLIRADQAPAELESCRLMPSAREHDIEAERRAERGDTVAQIHLGEISRTGVLYADGGSRPPDYVSAYKWSLVTRSRFGRDALATKLTPAQIAEAEEQARQLEQALGRR